MTAQAARPIALIAAFAVVYFVWGSTYLAIRIAVMDVPPGLLAGVRFLVAGLILGAIALARGHDVPRDPRVWRVSAVMGVALVVIGNGFVTWAEQWVPSNQAALIIASSALWMAWFGTFGPRGTPLSGWTKLGLAVGFAGVALLMLPDATGEGGLLVPMLAILGSSMAWCAGTIYGRNAGIEVPPLIFAACQMLIGGSILTVWGIASGELGRVEWTSAGLIGLAYLTLIGSCLAYGTYMWLIRHTTPARLATVAYVNPVVATVLGWWVLGETLVGLQLVGMAVIFAGVVMVGRK
jgi:drug/metabolite transporter (DMT)-like permease